MRTFTPQNLVSGIFGAGMNKFDKILIFIAWWNLLRVVVGYSLQERVQKIPKAHREYASKIRTVFSHYVLIPLLIVAYRIWG